MSQGGTNSDEVEDQQCQRGQTNSGKGAGLTVAKGSGLQWQRCGTNSGKVAGLTVAKGWD